MNIKIPRDVIVRGILFFGGGGALAGAFHDDFNEIAVPSDGFYWGINEVSVVDRTKPNRVS